MLGEVVPDILLPSLRQLRVGEPWGPGLQGTRLINREHIECFGNNKLCLVLNWKIRKKGTWTNCFVLFTYGISNIGTYGYMVFPKLNIRFVSITPCLCLVHVCMFLCTYNVNTPYLTKVLESICCTHLEPLVSLPLSTLLMLMYRQLEILHFFWNMNM